MNARLLLTTTILLVVSAVGVLAASNCEPDCVGHASGDYVEDPLNCTQYYICLADQSPSDFPLACDTGHFDPAFSDCVPGDTCNATCTPPVCNVTCKTSPSYVADPLDCSVYYMCDAALHAVGPFDCPLDKPYFNGDTCTKDDSQCCKPQCSPYCNPGDVQIIDPKDCTKYYICEKEGKPLESNHHTCPAGQNFDIASSRCQAGARCVVLCGDVVGTTPPGGGTTTPPGGGGTTTPPGGTGCVSSLICQGSGDFAMCTTCQPWYFHCTGSGQSGEPKTCPDGRVFNTNPDFPFCVLPSNCPYELLGRFVVGSHH